MNREKMGEKRRCLSCNTAFFDLNRTKINCPKCAAVFQVIEPIRSSARHAGTFNSRSKWPKPPADVGSSEAHAAIINSDAADNVAIEIQSDDHEKLKDQEASRGKVST